MKTYNKHWISKYDYPKSQVRFLFSPSDTLWLRCLANTRGHPHQPGPCAVLLHQVRGHGTPGDGTSFTHSVLLLPAQPLEGQALWCGICLPGKLPPEPEPPATLPGVLVSTPQMLGPGSVELLRSQRPSLTLSSPNVCSHLSFPFCALSHLLIRLTPLPSPLLCPCLAPSTRCLCISCSWLCILRGMWHRPLSRQQRRGVGEGMHHLEAAWPSGTHRASPTPHVAGAQHSQKSPGSHPKPEVHLRGGAEASEGQT